MNSEYDRLVKLLLIGNAGVGKSCLLSRYCDDLYDSSSLSTIGVDFKIKSVTINDKNVRVQIWDTAGQERYRSISSSYYRGAHGAIIIYDITNSTSFMDVNKWVEEVTAPAENITLLLVGCKCDQERKREVTYEEGETKARELRCDFFEVSSRTKIGVEEVFDKIATTIVNKYQNNHCVIGKNHYNESINITLKSTPTVKQPRTKIC